VNRHWRAGTFFQHVKCVNRRSAKSFGCSAWPTDFDRIDFGRRCQAKVQSHIALRHVTTAAADLRYLHEVPRLQGYPGSDGISIRANANQFERDPVSVASPIDK